MFAEEEWTDSPSADGWSEAVNNKVSSAPGKQEKIVGRRSLLRTLQTLGSVPDWKTEKHFVDSEEETVESSAPTKTKKKRCKKRRKTSNVDREGEQNEQLDLPETPAKKKKPVKKIKKEPGSKVSQESKDESDKGAPVEKEADQSEQRLNRKQWKNRMKNKRRCRNKYLEKTKQDDNVKTKEKSLVRLKDVPATQKVQKDQRSSKKIKSSPVKNGISSVEDNVKNDSPLKISSDHLQCVKADTFCTGTQAVSDCVSNNNISHEVGDKVKPQKMTKKSQMRANKLRQIFAIYKSQSTGDSNKDKDEQEEHNSKTVPEEEQPVPDRSSLLRSKMEKRLEAARFRHINELLYTSTSGEARRMFQQDPKAIGIYHRGYTAQVQHWPSNPVDSIISYIRQRPASLVVADFGCGDCKIARSVKNKVHSFDLAPVCDLATACDMSKVPLRDSAVDIVVFCLSLMGTNIGDFLAEANRVLVMGGVLKIAEVASRFDDARPFTGAMSSLGFKLVNKDTENSHFYLFEFIKTGKAPENVKRAGLNLKPCLYKKR